MMFSIITSLYQMPLVHHLNSSYDILKCLWTLPKVPLVGGKMKPGGEPPVYPHDILCGSELVHTHYHYL
jgi:hypothetical protein